MDEKQTETASNEQRIKNMIQAAGAEAVRAINLHGRFRSAHEAYGVLLEEVEEFWDEVKKKRHDRSPAQMRAELIQIAAVAIKAGAFIELAAATNSVN